MLNPFTFLVYLFLLTVGKSPLDIQEFARIRGEWDVVGVEAEGKKLPPGVWHGKTVVIALVENAKEQPANSLAYWGRLNTRRSRPALESRFLTINTPLPEEKGEAVDPLVPPYPKIPPIVYGVETVIIYDAQGDTLRILITQVSSGGKLPNKLETDANSRGMLFLLKRKTK